MITVSIQRPWSIRTPSVVRYMNKQFVDAFFNEGKLRLSSFAQFGRHADEQRLDSDEGSATLWGQGDRSTVIAVVRSGLAAYVLCGTTVHSEEMQKRFGCNDAFRINDTTSFAAAVAGAIPHFVGGIEGQCLYRSERRIARRLEELDDYVHKQFPNEKEHRLEDLMRFNMQIAQDDNLFLKNVKYQDQNEYRLIWHIQRETDGFLDVTVPDAVRFCERVAAD